MIKTKFFQTCVGVSMVLLSLGFFFHSIQSTTAAPTPDKFFQTGSDKIGKYSMCMFASGSGMVATILNTETGVSMTYSYNGGPWEKLPNQFPKIYF